MKKASLIFKVCGLFLAVHTVSGVNSGGEISIPTDVPLSMLHGEYQVKNEEMKKYRPTWASIWKIHQEKDILNGNFFVSLWPPKYCHAVYLCPFKTQDYNGDVNFKTDEEICTNEYIKYFPHVKKLVLKSNNDVEVTKFWTKNRLEFEIDAAFKVSLRAFTTEPESQGQMMAATIDNSFSFENMDKKDILILTNSRMCQVNKIGTEFYPIFKYGIQQDTSGIYPQWIHVNKTFVNSDYLPPVKTSAKGKTIDLLSYLKKKEWSNGPIGKLKKTCQPVAGWKAGGRHMATTDKSAFTKVSVNSYEINLNMAIAHLESIRTFSLNVEKCHWFRLWFTEKGTMANYNDMKLEETVDFFINEGFYISPESDTAYPLPGVHELTKFTFTSPHNTPNKGIVDMNFGELRGSWIYHDQFNIKAADTNKFNLHIIKAPACEISVDTRSSVWKKTGGYVYPNHWNFGVCQFSHFKK